MKMEIKTRLVLAVALLTLSTQSGRAAIVLQESFDYGTTGGTLVGKGTATDGWGGSWSQGTFTYTGSPTYTEAYQTGGLTFGTLATSGGNAFVYSTGDGGINMGREHSTSITGTLYGSYLYRSPTGAGFTGLASLFEGTSLTIPSNYAQFAIEPDRYASTLGATLMDQQYGTSGGTAISANETYLVLFKVTNLGPIAATHEATMWILRDSQYNNFISGGLTESELNSAALGTGSTQILQRATDTNGSMVAEFASGNFLMMQSYFGVQAQFDEIRISNSSFDEVLGVPEPSRALLLVMSLGTMIVRRRRA
jgi:hypothetical protein